MYIVRMTCPTHEPKLKEKLQPYITKHYFGLQNPPVNLAKIAIGNGVLTNVFVFAFLPVVRISLLLFPTGGTDRNPDPAHHDRNIPPDDRL